MNEYIEVNGRRVGPGYPVYIIAELSANHGQDLDKAVKLVEAAKEVGADAVKLQTYTPDTLTMRSDKKYFRIGGGTLWDGRTLYDLYSEAYMPWEWQPRLKEIADEMDLDLFSTAYDETAIDFLEDIDVPVHKVASFENVDLPLLRKFAQTGKPIIMSAGMTTLDEIAEAVRTIREAGGAQLGLLKCTSAYPALPEEMHLRTIPHLARTFDVPIGLSDHTMGIAVSAAAVALGACIVEKHFTLSRDIPGPDSAFSLEPREFKAMVEAVRVVEKSLGEVRYQATEREMASRVFRRSLFVIQDIVAGDVFTEENVRSIRPGYGLHTRHLEQVIGQRAARDIERGTPLNWGLIETADVATGIGTYDEVVEQS